MLLLLLFLLSACNKQTEAERDVITERAQTEDNTTGDELQLNYIVSVAEGYNYDSLKAIAKQTATLTYMTFDTLERYYNPKKGIILHEKDADEEWAGKYFLRRMGSGFISIEMRNAYIDTTLINHEAALAKHTQDSTRMFVFAMMYPHKKSADSLAQLIKPRFPQVKVFPARIFMGCMH